MRKTAGVFATILVIALVLSMCSMVAFADSSLDTPIDDPIESLYAEKSIYSDIRTRIYSGIGRAQWLHITPLVTPNNFVITMVDYDGTTVWQEAFVATGVTHWYIGANVQSVYLQGLPGGVVTITNSDN